MAIDEDRQKVKIESDREKFRSRMVGIEAELKSVFLGIENECFAVDTLPILDRVKSALDLIRQHGGIVGDHHKQWVLDRVARILTATSKGYEDWVATKTYGWDAGIKP